MRKRYLLLPVIVAAAGGTIALLQTEHSPQAEGIIAEAQVTRASHASTRTLESNEDRTILDPGESVSLSLKLHPGKGKVRLVAQNGGLINHHSRHAEFDPPASGQSIHLDYVAGTTPGRYIVEVSQGVSTRALEFWVGPELPTGQPGPERVFKR